MSNESKEYEDQAAELRKLFIEVQEGEQKSAGQIEPIGEMKEVIDDTPDPGRDIDILNLPPRKEIHSKKSTRTRLKIQRPFTRLAIVIIIIAGVLFGLYYIWGVALLNLMQF